MTSGGAAGLYARDPNLNGSVPALSAATRVARVSSLDAGLSAKTKGLENCTASASPLPQFQPRGHRAFDRSPRRSSGTACFRRQRHDSAAPAAPLASASLNSRAERTRGTGVVKVRSIIQSENQKFLNHGPDLGPVLCCDFEPANGARKNMRRFFDGNFCFTSLKFGMRLKDRQKNLLEGSIPLFDRVLGEPKRAFQEFRHFAGRQRHFKRANRPEFKSGSKLFLRCFKRRNFAFYLSQSLLYPVLVYALKNFLLAIEDQIKGGSRNTRSFRNIVHRYALKAITQKGVASRREHPVSFFNNHFFTIDILCLFVNIRQVDDICQLLKRG